MFTLFIIKIIIFYKKWMKIDIFCAVNLNIYIGIKENLLCLGPRPLLAPGAEREDVTSQS